MPQSGTCSSGKVGVRTSMQFIIRIGQSRFAPFVVSCSEDETNGIEEIVESLRVKADEEFKSIASKNLISPEVVKPVIGELVRSAYAKREGARNTFLIEDGRLKEVPPDVALDEALTSGVHYLDVLVLDDESVAERDAFVDQMFKSTAAN